MPDDAYQQMARQFFELWQKQISTMVTDKDFVQSMISTLHAMQFGASPQKRTDNATNAATSSHSTAFSPRPGLDRVADLERRLAGCEKRLGRLEQDSRKQDAKRKRTTVRRPARRVAAKTRRSPKRS